MAGTGTRLKRCPLPSEMACTSRCGSRSSDSAAHFAALSCRHTYAPRHGQSCVSRAFARRPWTPTSQSRDEDKARPTYIHTYLHTSINTYRHKCITTYNHSYYTHIIPYLHTTVHTYTHTHTFTYIHTYRQAYIHTHYTHTYMHTYIHTYIHT